MRCIPKSLHWPSYICHCEAPQFSRRSLIAARITQKIFPGKQEDFQKSSTRRIQSRSAMGDQRTVKLLVLCNKEAPELSLLSRLPKNVEIVATADGVGDLSAIKEEDLQEVEVVLNAGLLAASNRKADFQALLPRIPKFKWLHLSSAGIDHLMFPELVNSSVVITNAKGVYSHSLAEYCLTCFNWFAKDLPRMRAAQLAGKWEVYEVEELRGKTMGVVGYGSIGKECARLGKAFGMSVVALRRNSVLSESDKEEGVLDRLYPTDQLPQLMSTCDYVVSALPLTESTHKFLDSQAFNAMKPNGVFVNVGRGKTVDEEALIDVLTKKKIRGAGLDVFYQEPLPADSPIYKLENVLMSAHCADRTKEFQFEAMEVFLGNAERFVAGRELVNVVDPKAGY